MCQENLCRQAQILLVDDSEMEAVLVENSLRDSPLLRLMHVAKDGVEAMAFLRCEARRRGGRLPDIILLDINMPRMDGFEVLTHLKADPVLRTIPVVMFTTSDCQEDIDRAYAAGANCFLTKPRALEELDRSLRQLAEYWVETAQLPMEKATGHWSLVDSQ
jgi:CheY-like chemotaxis protein